MKVSTLVAVVFQGKEPVPAGIVKLTCKPAAKPPPPLLPMTGSTSSSEAIELDSREP